MRLEIVTILFAAGLAACAAGAQSPQARIVDLKHYSRVFGEERNVRVFLPPGYEEAGGKRYPVIYFFHGYGQRYNHWSDMLNGDVGGDYGGDNVSSFVGAHDVIVVRWDGYNPRFPGENYARPYNVGPVETERQFPLYFPELAAFIDSHFRTLADRDHRATSGLSMGGFMSFWIAGKYPQLVGSASNFMGSSEFVAGPKAFPAEYRHTEMYRNYEGMRTRIVLGSRDFILWYHRRMNAIWDFTRPFHETAEYDSPHGTPGMGDTLAFHMNAFRNPLPKPSLWHHTDVYPSFDVWGYSVSTDRKRPGFTVLDNVSPSGFRSSVREWLPGGALLPDTTVLVDTDRLYRAGAAYEITDVNLDTRQVLHRRQVADPEGRLRFPLNGARHEIGIGGAGVPVLTVAGWRVEGAPWATDTKPVHLNLAILNKGSRAAPGVRVTVSSPNAGVSFSAAGFSLQRLESGAQAGGEICFTVAEPSREILKLEVRLAAEGGPAAVVPVEVPLWRDVPEIRSYRVLDGGKAPLWLKATEKTEQALGSGNRDGVADPGETIAIAVPDRDGFRAVELFTSDDCVDGTQRLSDPWDRYDWVGESDKIGLPVISSTCAEGHEIQFFARYKLPNKPLHILKEGIVRIRVGKPGGGTEPRP
jgi:pimeloyl-ACP methyl ester carboxylesterase